MGTAVTAGDPLPPRLGARYDRHGWHRVTLGESGDQVWRLTGPSELYVKIGASTEAEAARAAWLDAQGIPVAEVVELGDGFLVTRALPGRPASDPWPADQRHAVIDAIADVTRRLHALDMASCPFDRTLDVTVVEARDAAARDAVKLEQLDAERTGWSADQLVAELDRTRPASEDLVVCHGDLCLPNVLIDPDTLTVTGLIDLARCGIADCHLDLAIATRSIALHPANTQFGPAMAQRFLDGYGRPEPDPALIAFYRLLDEFT